MKKIFSKELIIGLFTIAVIVGGYFGFLFLKNKKVFSDDITLYAVFNQADGLEASAPILVKGFRIGTVDKINFDMATQKLTVALTIDGKYDIPQLSEASIISTSLLGGKVIDIAIGQQNGKVLENGDTIRSSAARDMMDVAGEEYNKLKEQLGTIVDKLNSALDGVNRTLSIENTNALSGTLANLQGASGDIKDVISKEKHNIERLVSDLAVLSNSLKNSAPDLERGLKNIAKISDSLAVDGPVLVRNASEAVENLSKIIAQIQRGEGTAGKLVTDEQLYVNLTASLENLSLLLADLKANPKKYINVTVFGKREKAEKK